MLRSFKVSAAVHSRGFSFKTSIHIQNLLARDFALNETRSVKLLFFDQFSMTKMLLKRKQWWRVTKGSTFRDLAFSVHVNIPALEPTLHKILICSSQWYMVCCNRLLWLQPETPNDQNNDDRDAKIKVGDMYHFWKDHKTIQFGTMEFISNHRSTIWLCDFHYCAQLWTILSLAM